MSRKIPMVGDEADASTALHEALEQDGFIVDSYEDPLCFSALQGSFL